MVRTRRCRPKVRRVGGSVLLAAIAWLALSGMGRAATRDDLVRMHAEACSNIPWWGVDRHYSPALRALYWAAKPLIEELSQLPRPFRESEIESYETRAMSIVRRGPSEEARLFLKAVAEHIIANLYGRVGNARKALDHINLWLEVVNNPAHLLIWPMDKAFAYVVRGDVLRELGRKEEALADFEAARKLGCRELRSGEQSLEGIIADLSREISAEPAALLRVANLVDDARRRAKEAQQKGDMRGALGIYTTALASFTYTRWPAALVREAIDAAAKLSPPPPIPEEARKHAVFAQTAFKEAKAKNDFEVARAEYRRALALAPWWADAWVTLSAVDEKLGDYAAAERDLENYLRAAPRAPDRDAVQNKIYELQFKAREKGQIASIPPGRSYLGVEIQEVTAEIVENLKIDTARGAFVVTVLKDGPADRAGIEDGDVIVEFDGNEIKAARDLPPMVARTPANKKVLVKVLRNKKEITLPVTIGDTGEVPVVR